MRCSLLVNVQVPRRWPRRPLPGHLWRALVTGTLSLVGVVRQWLDESADRDPYLVGIRRLANSVAAIGLINPILVTGDGLLVSGLRRVLAHAYLVVQGETRFDHIATIVVDSSWSVAQQLAEALVRADLGAVEKAINLGLLIVEIEVAQIAINQPFLGADGAITLPIELRKHLADRRIYGTWKRVSAILGKTSRHWNNYEQILTLCDPALTLAHQAGLTEWALRKVVSESIPCEAQVRRIREMIEGKPLEEDTAKPSRFSRPAMAVKTALDAATFWALLPSGELDRVAADTFNAHNADDFEALYQIVEKIVIALEALREQDIDKFSQRKSLEAKRLRKASDYLSSLQPDNLDRAIAELFSDQRIANLEKFYQAGERMRTALGKLRGKHHLGYQK